MVRITQGADQYCDRPLIGSFRLPVAGRGSTSGLFLLPDPPALDELLHIATHKGTFSNENTDCSDSWRSSSINCDRLFLEMSALNSLYLVGSLKFLKAEAQQWLFLIPLKKLRLHNH